MIRNNGCQLIDREHGRVIEAHQLQGHGVVEPRPMVSIPR